MRRWVGLLLLVTGCAAADVPPHHVTPGAVETVDRPSVPLPLQPFTVELLDSQRGQWHFDDALGQHLSLPGPVTAFAFDAPAGAAPRLGYLCCDPEFPQDLAHAVLKRVAPSLVTPQATWYRFEEPYLSASVGVFPARDGVVRCELRDISLGPAIAGDRYVGGLYLCFGERAERLWLAPDHAEGGLNPRLLTDRVGHVFTEGEPVTLTLAASTTTAAMTVAVSDYATGTQVWHSTLAARPGAGLRWQPFALPLQRFGVFEVTAAADGVPPARLRICRVPKPRAVDPDRSAMGINLFQQQVWWYAWQAPLMARAGVHWIRPWLAWENVWRTQEPKPGAWDTRALDAALRRMARFDQRYQCILFSAPDWVAGGNACGAPPVDKLDLWSAYVERLVKQYRGRIRYWEVWNEPDGMWPDATRAAGEHYAALLRATHAAAKRADPDCLLLGISHAGDEDWLARLGKLGVADTFDIATVHSYAAPHDFVQSLQRRRALLDQGGMSGKPMWANELGVTAYDFNPAYSAKYDCSERQQASYVPALYAQALSMDGTPNGRGGKAFWFCTYDPRDAAHESQWTGDCGVGVLYLGFLPKLSYAALAATAKEIDGRACWGRFDLDRDRHAIAFEDDVAVVWHDRPKGVAPLPATALGCLPDERLTVRDTYANEVANGRAADLRLDLAQGPLFVEGSAQLSAVARCERTLDALPTALTLDPGQTRSLALAIPAGAVPRIAVPAGLPVEAAFADGTLRLTVAARVQRAFGAVRLTVSCAAGTLGLVAPHDVVRHLAVSVGEPNLVRDGGFTAGDTAEWVPQFNGDYAWDGAVGHAEPGSLRLEAGGDRRLVQWNLTPVPGRPLRFSGWVKTADLAGCRATLTVALFAADHWIRSYCLATTDPHGTPAIEWPMVDQPARIPLGTADWTRLEAELPGAGIPPESKQMACHVDVRGGRGRLWLDDLDLWQPAP
jgi:hypothetical protein